ncbi:NAD(P)-dependent alcohol dehydrogenase [Verticiella sediminum]|uniref:NAD(P)-dependent alcohol dehydrogenase n=1 Tax=Verticiella sediminum TaxID=1247510 RepID=A0A556AUW9_9BURK|nr:NAD(P)-dependent alcohol dehydrogenase [Verticiella sediminum]TSH96742.1 NAD(P)-dependent alcohol dehydrogenase [Verticiella sediminum]
MKAVKARCTCGPRQPFISTLIPRRAPGPSDVVIAIAFAGICHSDVEHAHSLRGSTRYPLVPGHEMAGKVIEIGSHVTRFRVGDRAGVGNMVDSCGGCANCLAGLEQYCSGHRTLTYNSLDRHGEPTHGGYSEQIVVDERFVVRVPDTIPLENAAPLLCAGITMYSPLRHWKAGPGSRVAVIGLGGLGHVGIQMARAMGAEVTVLELDDTKRDDALRLGASEFVVTTSAEALAPLANRLDLIISTVPATLDMDRYLGLLARDGVFVQLAAASQPLAVPSVSLLTNRRSIAGTRSGGLAETQEMLDFCAEHGIRAEIELIAADRIDEAYERLLAGDVRYRFVIDNSTL